MFNLTVYTGLNENLKIVENADFTRNMDQNIYFVESICLSKNFSFQSQLNLTGQID